MDSKKFEVKLIYATVKSSLQKRISLLSASQKCVEAEKELKSFEFDDDFSLILCQIVTSNESVPLIKSAAVYLLNCINSRWSSKSKSFQRSEIREETKESIKEMILRNFIETRSTKHEEIDLILSAIARQDWPGAWINLTRELNKMLNSKNVQRVHRAAMIFSKFLKEMSLTTVYISEAAPVLFLGLSKIIGLKVFPADIVLDAVKLFNQSLQLLADNDSGLNDTKKYLFQIVPNLILDSIVYLKSQDANWSSNKLKLEIIKTLQLLFKNFPIEIKNEHKAVLEGLWSCQMRTKLLKHRDSISRLIQKECSNAHISDRAYVDECLSNLLKQVLQQSQAEAKNVDKIMQDYQFVVNEMIHEYVKNWMEYRVKAYNRDMMIYIFQATLESCNAYLTPPARKCIRNVICEESSQYVSQDKYIQATREYFLAVLLMDKDFVVYNMNQTLSCLKQQSDCYDRFWTVLLLCEWLHHCQLMMIQLDPNEQESRVDDLILEITTHSHSEILDLDSLSYVLEYLPRVSSKAEEYICNYVVFIFPHIIVDPVLKNSYDVLFSKISNHVTCVKSLVIGICPKLLSIFCRKVIENNNLLWNLQTCFEILTDLIHYCPKPMDAELDFFKQIFPDIVARVLELCDMSVTRVIMSGISCLRAYMTIENVLTWTWKNGRVTANKIIYNLKEKLKKTSKSIPNELKQMSKRNQSQTTDMVLGFCLCRLHLEYRLTHPKIPDVEFPPSCVIRQFFVLAGPLVVARMISFIERELFNKDVNIDNAGDAIKTIRQAQWFLEMQNIHIKMEDLCLLLVTTIPRLQAFHYVWKDELEIFNMLIKSCPRAGVAVIDSKGQYLLLVQGFALQAMKSLPKGKIEDGKTAFETAIHEVEEESGLDISRSLDKNLKKTVVVDDHDVTIYLDCSVNIDTKISPMTLGEIKSTC